MGENVIVTGTHPNDTDDFVKLFIISGPEYVPALFAGRHETYSAGCFRHRKNLVSSEHTHFMKANGANAGMVLAYDWRTKKSNSLRSTFWTLWYMRLTFFKRMRDFQWSEYVLSCVEDGTYYISNLAFFPEFRSQGLGSRLMEHIEVLARKAGAHRIDVDAETYNKRAIQFYERFGMKAEGELKRTAIDGQEFEFVRLTKTLAGPG